MLTSLVGYISGNIDTTVMPPALQDVMKTLFKSFVSVMYKMKIGEEVQKIKGISSIA